MSIVIDANILLRLVDATSAQHAVTFAALNALQAQGRELRTVPQSFYEFWVVATRPVANNGLGLTTTECAREVDRLVVAFPILPDPPDLFDQWRALVLAHDCKGKIAHDARLVAAMSGHNLTGLLTFNAADFRRFPGVALLDPATPTP